MYSQVDQLFGRDHLFKRSIILVKAWCYYESRILGANTGLISTYALAVLVLYIINLFHSSLSGPLAVITLFLNLQHPLHICKRWEYSIVFQQVLYKFLDYYGSFDWNNYCISVNGPVPISSLPELTGKDDAKNHRYFSSWHFLGAIWRFNLVLSLSIFPAASPENGHELLLDEKFLRNCVELYSAPTKAVDSNGLEFPIKHLNIVDPLKYSNNLGKSVTQGTLLIKVIQPI